MNTETKPVAKLPLSQQARRLSQTPSVFLFQSDWQRLFDDLNGQIVAAHVFSELLPYSTNLLIKVLAADSVAHFRLFCPTFEGSALATLFQILQDAQKIDAPQTTVATADSPPQPERLPHGVPTSTPH